MFIIIINAITLFAYDPKHLLCCVSQTVQRGVYRDLADTRGQGRAHFLASSALYEAAYTTVRSGTHALLVEDTTCRKVYSDDFTKHGILGDLNCYTM